MLRTWFYLFEPILGPLGKVKDRPQVHKETKFLFLKTEYPNQVTIMAANPGDPESTALEKYLNFGTGFGRCHRVAQLALALVLGKRFHWHTSIWAKRKMKNKNPT